MARAPIASTRRLQMMLYYNKEKVGNPGRSSSSQSPYQSPPRRCFQSHSDVLSVEGSSRGALVIGGFSMIQNDLTFASVHHRIKMIH